MKNIVKRMTWQQMQQHKLVGDAFAFWQLPWVEILEVFGLHQLTDETESISITEGKKYITVTVKFK